MIAQVDEIIDRNNPKIDKTKCKVLKSPLNSAAMQLPEFLLLFDFDLISSKRKEVENDLIDNYKKQLRHLTYYNTREYDVGTLNFFIPIYKENRHELLLSIYNHNNLERKGLITWEPYIVNIFENLFDSAWAASVIPSPNQL